MICDGLKQQLVNMLVHTHAPTYSPTFADLDEEAVCLGNLGNNYDQLGRLEEAMTCFRQQLEIVRQTGHRKQEATALGYLSRAYQVRAKAGGAQVRHACGARVVAGSRLGAGWVGAVCGLLLALCATLHAKILRPAAADLVK